jgi:orotidine-5'-phosphate decarboxylase
MNRETGLILALDVTSRDKALSLAGSLGDYFDAIKIGYPLILASGLEIVRDISSMTHVIADLKIADIPNTNRLICEQVLEAGANGLIAHAFTGKDSLRACVDCARGFNADLFAVTEMSHPGALDFMAPLAEELARMAVEAGASGVVAPATRPERISLIRSVVGDRTIISPGVGAQGGSARDAFNSGADFIIIGRSVTEAEDPEVAVQMILSKLMK